MLEAEEFAAADAILRAAVPILDEDHMEAPSSSKESAPCATVPPILYWHRDILYQTRTFVIAKDGAKDLKVRIRDFYLNDGSKLGSGFRAWDASVMLAKWVHGNKGLFAGKVVIELGAGGSGLPGLVASLSADSVHLTDCVPTLLENMRHNLQLNAALLRKDNCHIAALDWCQLKGSSVSNADIAIGAEVIYDGVDVKALLQALDKHLRRPHGLAYLVVMTEGRGSASRIEFEEALKMEGWSHEKSPMVDVMSSSLGDEAAEADTRMAMEHLMLYTISRRE